MRLALSRLAAVAVVLLTAMGASARADTLTPQQKDAIEHLVHDYLVAHPEVIVEALKAAQQKNDAEAADHASKVIAAQRAALFSDPDSPVGGNPKGDVTIVEFFDYRCPYCKEVEPSLEALLKEDAKLRIVYKEFPILGAASVYASRAAFAARLQGKYDEFHRVMMATKGSIDEQVVLRVAGSVGLDLDKVKADIGNADTDRIIKSDYSLADELDIQGTPAFVVGNKLVPGEADIDTLRRLVKEARSGG